MSKTPQGVTDVPTRSVRLVGSSVSKAVAWLPGTRTAGVPIIQGREFQVTDKADSPRVAIVNEMFGHTYYPSRSAVGQRLRMNTTSGPRVEIVGVAK